MNQEEIKKILPHRDNMLLVEEAEKIDDVTSKGRYTIKGDEFFYRDIFRAILLFRVLFSAK